MNDDSIKLALTEYQLMVDDIDTVRSQLKQINLRRWLFSTEGGKIDDMGVEATWNYVFGNLDYKYTIENYYSEGQESASMLIKVSSIRHQLIGAMRVLDAMGISYDRYDVEDAIWG